MKHPSALELSMYADAALTGDPEARVAAHLESCNECQTRIAGLKVQTRQIEQALASDSEEALTIPKFSRPASLRGFALANIGTGLVIWLAQMLWKSAFEELVLSATSRAMEIYLPNVYDLISSTTLFLIEEGTAMFDAYLAYIVVSVLALGALALFVWRYRSRAILGLFAGLFLAGSVLQPIPAEALEVRRSDGVVELAASETVDDTLLVAAESILIEGTVKGDLLAAARQIRIKGKVEGNLVAFAESVDVEGAVGGLVLSAADTIMLEGETGGDVWLAGEKIRLEGSVARNATIAGNNVAMNGVVARDLTTFVETVEISGELGRDLQAFAARVNLLSGARISGDVTLRTSEEDRLFRSDSAAIGGEVRFLELPEEFKPKSRYSDVEFYLWLVAQFLMALLFGWVLLSLFPALRSLTVEAGMEGLKTAGVGLLALVSVPVIVVVLAVTIIGIPFALLTLVLWLAGLYLAQIIVASVIGRMVLPEASSLLKTLALGLVIVILARQLPFIGGVFGFIVMLLGIGLFVQLIYRFVSSRGSASA